MGKLNEMKTILQHGFWYSRNRQSEEVEEHRDECQELTGNELEEETDRVTDEMDGLRDNWEVGGGLDR
ncbi:hypothetical protein TWF281_009757 [Arthrobotrys megalospora]